MLGRHRPRTSIGHQQPMTPCRPSLPSPLCRRTNAIALIAADRRRGLHDRRTALVAAARSRCLLLCLEGRQLRQGTVSRCAGAAAPTTTQRVQAFGGADMRHAAAAALARGLGRRVPHDGRVLALAAAALAIAVTVGSVRGSGHSALLARPTRCCTLSGQLPVL